MEILPNKMKAIATLIVIGSIVLLLAGPTIYIFYVIAVHKTGEQINVDQQHLSNFATFSGFFVSIANLVVTAITTYLVYQATTKINHFQMETVLDFNMTFPNGAEMINCNNATIRNIYVRYKRPRIDGIWSRWVLCYTLPGGEKKQLRWMKGISEIEACYSDYMLQNRRKLIWRNGKVESIVEISSAELENLSMNSVNSIQLDGRLDLFQPKFSQKENHLLFDHDYFRWFRDILFPYPALKHKHKENCWGTVGFHEDFGMFQIEEVDSPVNVEEYNFQNNPNAHRYYNLENFELVEV